MPTVSFRVRLLLLVALAILPALLLIVYNASEQRSIARDHAQQDADRVAQINAGDVSRQIETVHALLQSLALVPEVLRGDSDCSVILREAVARFSYLASVSLASPDGSVRCASVTPATRAFPGQTDSFFQASETGRFSLGKYHADPITSRPAADVSYPIPTASGARPGVLTAEFDLERLTGASSGDLRGAVFYTVDRDGRILTLATIPGIAPGMLLAEQPLREWVIGQRGPGLVEARGPDGVKRLYGIRPIAAEASVSPYVVYGTPSSQVFADANFALRRNLILLGAVAILAFGAAWTAGDFFFVRRVRALLAGTRAVAAGDLATRIPDTARDELGTLAHSFNDMTAALAVSVARATEKEAELTALFAAMTDVIFVIGRDGVLQRVAPTGFPGELPEHLVGSNIDDVFPPADAAAFKALVHEALDTGRTVSREYSVLDPEGQRRWFEPAISRLTADSVVWVARDHTERHDMLERIREREQQYREIFESSSDGIVIVGLDGRLADANPAICRMHGYTRDEFMALPPGFYIHAEDRDSRQDMLAGIGEGRPYRLRARGVRKDGSEFHVDVLGAPIAYQGTTHVLAVVRDVSEQVETERVLEGRVEERTHEIATLLDVSRAIASTIDVSLLGPLILDRLRDAIGYEACLVLVREGDDLSVWQARGPESTDVSAAYSLRFPYSYIPELAPGLHRGEPVIIDDVLADHPWARAYRQIVGRLAATPAFDFVRCWLGVPLIVNDRMVGLLSLSSATPGYYSQRQADLALAIGASTASAVENARLFAETQARNREISTLFDISRSIASTIDMSTLRTLILDRLRDVVGYVGCAILAREGDDLVLVDARGPADAEAESVVGVRFPLAKMPHLARAIEAARPVIIDDVRADRPDSRDFRRVIGPLLESPPFRYVRSWLGVPLVVNDRAVGLLSLTSPEPGGYTERDATLALAIGTTIASAIENARLFAETEARTRELATLLDVSRGVVSTIDLQQLLGEVLDQLRTVIPYAGSSIMRLDGDDLVLIESRGQTVGVREEDAVGYRFPLAKAGVLRDHLVAGSSFITGDIRGADAYARSVRDILGSRIDTPAFRYIRSQILVPLVARDRVIGAMTVSRSETGAFDTADLDLAVAFASQAAIAIDNAEHFQRAEGRTRELSTLLEVSRSVASTIELQPLLALILDQLRNVIPYHGASVMQRDGNAVTVLESRGPDPDRRDAAAAGMRFDFGAAGGAGEGLVFSRPSLTPDIHGDDEHAVAWRRVVGSLIDLPRFRDIHAHMIVPLVGREGVMGALSVSRREIDAFTPGDLELAMAFASQAAVAIENAALFQQREQRVRETETLARVASSLTFARPLGETLDAVAAEAVAATNGLAADVAVLADGTFRAGGVCNLPHEFIELAARAVADGAHSPSVEAAQTLQSFSFADARTRILGQPQWALIHPILERAQWEGMVTVPLVSRGKGLGSLDVYYPAGGMPGPGERDFLRAIADQAAIAVENALLFEQTRDRAREQETLAAIAGSVSYAQPLGELLDNLSRNIAEGIGAVASAIVLFDAEMQNAEVTGNYGLPPGYLPAAIRGWQAGRLAETLPVRGGGTIVIRDARQFLRDNPAYAETRGFLGQTEWDNFVIVPLSTRQRSRGVLLVYLRKGDDPSPDRLRFFRAVADQATVAVENARLFDEVRARTRQLQALYRADEELHRSLVLDDVLGALLDVVIDLLEADFSSLILWDPAVARPKVMLRRDVPAEVADAIADSLAAQGRDATVAGYLPLGAREFSAIEDLDSTTETTFARDRTRAFGIRALLEVPVIVAGELFAVLTAVYRQPRTFNEGETRAFTGLARRAALAIENARLYAQAQDLAAVEERQRLARELHDSVSQALYGIALGARTARTLLDRDPARAVDPVDYVLSLAEAGLAEMRALIFELRPESLETEGLIAAIGKHVAATRARYGIDVEADLCAEPEAPLAVKEAVYRIAQEGLHNVVKHARATHAVIRVQCDAAAVVLDLRDNGIGFDPGGDFPGHLGLRSMRERATRLGGGLAIESAPGAGARLHATVPLL